MSFGAMSTYDAWVTREPDYPDPVLPGDDRWPRCQCGAWLRMKEDRTEPWEDGFDCDGTEEVVPSGDRWSACGLDRGPHAPHRVTCAGGLTYIRLCRKCGAENREIDL